jgi:tetratricopeptide (TPR) repeat protein
VTTRFRVTAMLSSLIVIGAGWDSVRATARAEATLTPASSALAYLHDGRFDEADRTLDIAIRSAGEDAEFLFLRAFTTYWRMIYDEDDPALRRRFELQLDRALFEAENRVGRNPADLEASFWAGTTRLFLAQLRASDRKPFAAAFEARRAKRHLELALGGKPDGAEPLFGLGTYNYMADRVPAFVRGLRAILFLPGGDRGLGLRQLERAASESQYFALAARMLLVTIYSHRHERLYAEADTQARLALDRWPNTVAVLHAGSLVDLMLGRPDAAAAKLDHALERSGANVGTDPAVRATLAYHRARADFARFRQDLALVRIRAVLEGGSIPPSLRTDLERLAALSRSLGAGQESGSPAAISWRRSLSALELEMSGRGPEAADRLLGLARQRPDDAVLSLLAGRALVREGRGQEALPLLRHAERSGRLPDAWVGPCRLLLGRAADLAGYRSEAVEAYRRATEAPGFIGREAAWYHQDHPYGTAS